MLILSLLIGTGLAQEAPPIVNGSTTQDFESVGAITMVHQGEHYSFCSGTLIHPEYVLTAAHCVAAAYDYDRQGIKIKFTLGHNMGKDSGIDESLVVEEYLEHPDYSASANLHDIGILKLKNAMVEAIPMRLNETGLNPGWQGLKLDYVGFGITDDNLENGGKKRTARIPIVSWDQRVVYSYDAVSNLCSGDSGGAAVRVEANGDRSLVGVNSFVFGVEGSDPCDGGGSGATRVDTHMDWIEEEVPLDEVNYSEPDPEPEPDPEEEFTENSLPDRPLDSETVGACASAPQSSPPAAWLLLLSGILLSRRRRER
jgi:MYXO-CTERM domain-containing protein